MRFLVTGGTGHLGTSLVARLVASGHSVRVFARSRGNDPAVEWAVGDLATGDGIEAAVAGIDRVIHAATRSPVAQRGTLKPIDLFRSPDDVDVAGTRRLIEAASGAGVGHFTYVSIVGLRHTRLVPYSRVKLAGEAAVRRSPVPWAIVRATPFYWLLERLFTRMVERGRVIAIPAKVRLQPVDSDEFAAFVADAAAGAMTSEQPDFAGPEVVTLRDLWDQYVAARGFTRGVREIQLPNFLSDVMSRGQVASSGRRGLVTWRAWLDAHEPSLSQVA